MNKNSLTNKFVNEILDLILNETNKVIFQHEKMKKIREINKNAKMSTLEKQKLISQIMLSQYQEEIKEEELTINIECKHYQRNCLILAECCQKFYPCRICHDEKEDHKINRYLTKMKCKLCNEIQDVSNECITCNEKWEIIIVIFVIYGLIVKKKSIFFIVKNAICVEWEKEKILYIAIDVMDV